MSGRLLVSPPVLEVKTPYDPVLPQRFRELGGKWDGKAKAWLFPMSRLEHLVQSFPNLFLNGEVQKARAEVLEWARRFAKAAEEVHGTAPLLPEQKEDFDRMAGALLSRVTEGWGWAYLLANGTGTGKTYLYAALSLALVKAGVRVLVVVPNEDLSRQTAEVLSRFGLQAGKDVSLTTYARFTPEEAWGRLLVLDEAHLAKNYSSERGRKARYAAEKSFFTLFATATPFDKPWEARYLLEHTGFLREVRMSFDEFMRNFKVGSREGFGGGREYYFFGSAEDLARFHQTLEGRRFMSKRFFRPREGMVEHEVPIVDLPKKEKRLLAEVRRRLKEVARQVPVEERGMVMAQRTIFSRALLERMKLKAALPLVERLLKEGWHVLLFLQYRAERIVDLSSPEAVEAFLEESGKEAKSNFHRYFARALSGMHITLPSNLEIVRSHFGHLGDALGFYTGEQGEGALKRVKRAWDEGKVRLLVATASKGGTGLSFHDTKGDRPTAQVVLTLPWTATQLDQILGRVVRVGMKSPVKILLPAAPVPFERKLATVIAQSLRTLGHAVRGGEGVVPDEVVKAFLYDLAQVDPEGFQALIRAEEALGEDLLLED